MMARSGFHLIVFWLCLTGSLLAQPAAPFARYIGSPGNYPPEYRIQPGPGGYFLLHNFVDSTLFVPQLSRVRNNGAAEWSRDIALSGVVSPRARLLLADTTGMLMAGTLQQNGYKTFVTRLDTSGGLLSNLVVDFGGYNEPVVLRRGRASCLIAGYRDFPDGLGHFTFDMTMVRLDSNDQVVRASASGNDSTDFTLTAAAILRDGRTVSVGEVGNRAMARFQSQLAWWSDRDSLLRMLQVDDGSFYTRLRPVEIMPSGDSALFVAASGSTIAGNEHEVVVFKLDTAGQMIWSRRYYQIAYDLEVRTMATDRFGRICLTGNCYRTVNDNGTFLLRLDQDGNVLDGALFKAPVFTFGGNATTDLLIEQDGSWTYPVYYYAGNLYTPALVHSDTSLLSVCADLNEQFVFAMAGANLMLLHMTPPDQEFLSVAPDTLGISFTNRSVHEGDLCLAVTIENDSFTNGAVMKVYPNPASDRVFLSGLSGDLELSILDVSGRAVYSTHQIRYEEGDPIRLPELTPGLYLLRVRHEEGSYIHRLLIR